MVIKRQFSAREAEVASRFNLPGLWRTSSKCGICTKSVLILYFFLPFPKTRKNSFFPSLSLWKKGNSFGLVPSDFYLLLHFQTIFFLARFFPKSDAVRLWEGGNCFSTVLFAYLNRDNLAASGLTTEGFSKLPKFDPTFPSATAGDWKQGNELEGEWLFAFWITKLYLSLWFDVDKTIVNGVLRLGSKPQDGLGWVANGMHFGNGWIGVMEGRGFRWRGEQTPQAIKKSAVRGNGLDR